MDAPSARASKDGVFLDVHVTASAKEDSVRYVDGVVKVKTSKPAENGKANKCVVRLLKPVFGACEIVAGGKSKRKTIRIQKMDLDGLKSVLEGLAEGVAR
ncbi:MAG: DUF167 family protein [Candidatus Altiarchaeota archaeon]